MPRNAPQPNTAGNTLPIARLYTTPGVHPYDQVEWEKRDVVQENWKTGEVVFEQRGVEFPKDWSVNASTIVTTKYFRGKQGTPDREHSLKQLVDRVVDTYVAAARDGGYITNPDDLEIFDHELKYMLVNQVFSFNSPVWFNVGTTSPQQVSACQPYRALVHTADGPTPIGFLVENNMVGTKVLNGDGSWGQILAVKDNGVKDVLRITTHSGHALEVTADHLVWKSTGQGSGSFVPAGDLRVGDALSWHREDVAVTASGPVETLTDAQAEAALAGWLLTDGFVGQYDSGTNQSLTVEPHTVNRDEYGWVEPLIARIWPNVHSHERHQDTQDEKVDFRRIRLYGEPLRPFVEKWGLLHRGQEMRHPEALNTAPLDVAAAYLRSLFQADGYVNLRPDNNTALIGISMESESVIRGAHLLLHRLGIFSRVHRHPDGRRDRNDRWVLSIQNLADRVRFANTVGFIGGDKANALEESLNYPGSGASPTKRLKIARIEPVGAENVYDIQTDTGEYLTSGGIRVHNCFILSVDDTMDSILNWYKEEGLIFKGGSGAGLNLSRIRSSKEILQSSGGTASGPVSFMRGADASAGTIKSGGATRRAAKMVVLDVDHPDIVEFVETKAKEEEKIRVLRDAGFDMDLGGADITSVQYQNANNSVRVSDEFMRAVESGSGFGLRARTSGDVIDTVDAKSLYRTMAEAAWACADPGIQYDDTINRWHTNPETGRITASNPCSEYMSLDDSSCNLASLNLMKFRLPDGTFDVDRFRRAVEFVITAMEVSISFADFPTAKIGKTTRDYRQLGIGYANLGALLMASGFAYDSAEGRAYAAAITSLMTGAAYRRSAEIASVMGPYKGYRRNASAHTRVMVQHLDAAGELLDAVTSTDGGGFVADGIVAPSVLAAPVAQAAVTEWETGIGVGSEYGWRNAQASVLAPTGTIGFMMDVDTTGIEPDFSLVKFKKMVGGGSLQIVNQRVFDALTTLGYGADDVAGIEEFIAEHGHVMGAPGLDPEHYEVFDCAVGERAILPMGHVRMMAAVQPFISGAISKTVNLPESATVEDIEEVFTQGWRLGLKAIAVYRDNCKVGQPLSDGKKKQTSAPSAPEPEVKIVEKLVERPARRRLPKKRSAETVSFTVGGAEGYLTVGLYDGDGDGSGGVGELFVKMSKQGSTLAGIMDAFSIAVSLGLQYGVPLEAFVAKFTNMRFEPAGMTDDPDVRMSQSLLDYMFRRVALDHMPYEERAAYGIYTTEERAQALASGGYDGGDGEFGDGLPPQDEIAPPATGEPFIDRAHTSALKIEAPMCVTCGTASFMVKSGACFSCRQCGGTTGCS